MKKLSAFILLTFFSSLACAGTVWIDVRSPEEYAKDHIEGDLQIAHDEIVSRVEQLFPEKETEIRLYCRSGRRADIAMTRLEEAGYTQVSNAGGISDARQERSLDSEE